MVFTENRTPATVFVFVVLVPAIWDTASGLYERRRSWSCWASALACERARVCPDVADAESKSASTPMETLATRRADTSTSMRPKPDSSVRRTGVTPSSSDAGRQHPAALG